MEDLVPQLLYLLRHDGVLLQLDVHHDGAVDGVHQVKVGRVLSGDDSVGLLELELQDARDYEGEGADGGSETHSLERLDQEVTAGTERVDHLVEYGEEQEDEDGVDDDHLLGLDGEGPQAAVHPGRLEGPPAAQLVEQREPDRDRNVEQEDPQQGLDVLHQLLPVLLLGHVQPVVLSSLPGYVPPESRPHTADHPEQDVPLGRVHPVQRLPEHEDEEGDDHHGSGNPEGEGVAGGVSQTFHPPQVGPDHEADEPAQVDGEVDDGEVCLELPLLVWQLELVPAQCGHDGVDTTTAHGE